MVKTKKFLIPVFVFLAGLLIWTGCNQAPAPVTPTNGSALTFSFKIPPPPPTPSAAAKAKLGKAVPSSAVSLNFGTLEYRITSGGDVITGGKSFDYNANLGTLSIPLPHDGLWLVSAEWFVGYYVGGGAVVGSGNVAPKMPSTSYYPQFVGADQVTVQGTTPFTLQMGDITLGGCSYDELTDVNYVSCYDSGSPTDVFTFDSATISNSTNGGTGDVQIANDPNTQSEFFQAGPGSNAKFAYLGTGDWLNFTSIPPGTKYYDNTELAKKAVLGGSSSETTSMDYNDVYLVQLSPTSHVWMQIPSFGYDSCNDGAYVYFSFRVNDQGYPFMKFEQTTYGKTYCSNEYYYGGCCY